MRSQSQQNKFIGGDGDPSQDPPTQDPSMQEPPVEEPPTEEFMEGKSFLWRGKSRNIVFDAAAYDFIISEKSNM